MKSSGAMHVGNQSRVVVIFFLILIKEIEGKKKWNSAKGNKKTTIWENKCQTKNG